MTQKRKTQTKDKIYTALLTLLKKYDIQHISILELCQTAKINRTTFYNHYGSQYDVLEEMAASYINHTALAAKKAIDSNQKFTDCLEQILKYIQNHYEFSNLIISHQKDFIFSLLHVSIPNFDSVITALLPDTLSDEQKHSISLLVQYGTVGIIENWIKNNCSPSYSQEAKLILFAAGNACNFTK